MSNLTERQKAQELYDLIGERGLYVSTNFDVFTKEPEEVPLAFGVGYKLPLIRKDSRAYTSPLLFATLTSLLNHGTMLITGAPGIGKTTGAEFAGHFFNGVPLEDILASEIQGHPQLTEEKMVASYDIGKLVSTGERIVIPGMFLKCPVKIIDEANRAPPDVLSIVMRLVDTGRAVYGGELLIAEPGPLFITANYSDEGTFQFTPPFLDRFDIAVMVTSPQPWDLRKIRGRGDEKLNGSLQELLEIPDSLGLDLGGIRVEIRDMPEAVENGVPVVSTFADFVYGSLRFSEAASRNITRTTKGNAWQANQDNAPPGHFTDAPFIYTLNELSIRTIRAVERYTKAFAWFNGEDKAGLDHLKAVLPYALWHKLQPTSKALAEDPVSANDRIAFVQTLIGKIENEYTEAANDTALQAYSVALSAIETGRIGDKQLSQEEIRAVAKNAITELGKRDKPYAITMASHIASAYNSRANGLK